MSALVVAPFLLAGALGCSISVPSRRVFGAGLSIGPNEGDWEVTVDGSRKLTTVDGPSPVLTSGKFFFNVDSGASFPTFRLTGDQLFRSKPLQPDFLYQYVVKPSLGADLHQDYITVSEVDGTVLGFYRLPWAEREDRGGFTAVSKAPYAVGYWSSTTRKQVYVVVQEERFGPVLLYVLDLDDGSWFEPVPFNGGFEQRGDEWSQLKTLDEFGVVESFTPCCACNDIEWLSFDAEGNTKPITTDTFPGDWGFDEQGNLLVTDFDSILIFRFPAYEKEVVAQFSDDKMGEALTFPLKCSEAEGNCPGVPAKPKVCGDEQTKLKFAGAASKRVTKGKHGPCECERACADADHWMLKLSSGRCFCYNGIVKKTVQKKGYVSGRNISE